MTTDRSNWFK